MFTRSRQDGAYVEVPALRRIVPYLLRTRTGSTVFFPQRIEVDGLLEWLRTTNAGRPAEERVSLFHVFLTAIGRTLRLRPEMNRFVAGRRTYEHREISVSFVVKASMSEEAPDTEARLVLSGRESVDDMRRMVDALVSRERGPERDADDRLVDFFASWPRPLLEMVSRGVTALDYHNALPRPLREAIPLFTSVYVVNTGSIGVDAPFHHLYDVGTASIFVSIGRAAREPVVGASGDVVARTVVNLVYTLDERASDGFYFARTAEVFRRLVSEPDLLARPDVTVDELVPVWPPPA
jgi:hypothetical protein